ncbi:hypothetical protein HNQ07_001467 [Deinococcus metalli]|uniref:DUF3108 domain-containing protein n=1 Tax=Deinococcus metalli TaxID=1141878 RepID=A0A7W8NPQ3_9DEIO|nr:hypothetical protein [Deinococcus metalli]MBB5376010.1 hypothetical protein [Deinococcus metalli]GHF41490.1 hypothetical protein GCM10017781_17730 [Deinococcus metalli]
MTPVPDPAGEGSGVRPGPESFSMTLTLGGRYAGEQHWTLTPERSAVVARVQTDFGGVLPDIRRQQTSRVHPRTLHSLGYAEGDGRGGRATFETTFDRRSGLVTLRQGRDEANLPLTTEYHDPVSLLLWLRAQGADGPERAHAHLTGGRVLIQRLPETEVGGEPAIGYFLRPGNAYVYVQAAPPHRLLRLIQPTDFGPVEANLDAQVSGTRRPERPERRRRRH